MKTTKKPSGRQAKGVTAKGLGHHVHWVGSVVLAPLSFPRAHRASKGETKMMSVCGRQFLCKNSVSFFVSAEISALPGNLGV